ncbi:hypothetical protein VIGAN_05155400, partial [Vigna angularis var. angularis]
FPSTQPPIVARVLPFVNETYRIFPSLHPPTHCSQSVAIVFVVHTRNLELPLTHLIFPPECRRSAAVPRESVASSHTPIFVVPGVPPEVWSD